MKHRMVFVDEEPMVISTLEMLFAKEPFEFYGFTSPHQALEQMEKIVPQVVLSDQRMPNSEGIHFLEKVQEKWPRTIRMILTGFWVPDRAQAEMNHAGVIKVLAKPWDDNHVLQQIRIAFHYFDIQRVNEINQCAICGGRSLPEEIHPQRSHYLCRGCRHCYELLPGVVFESLKRFLAGNVL